MDKTTILLVFLVVVLPLAGLLAVKWFKIFNSPDGERYRKRRVQGPFVPLSAEEIAADEARKH